MDDGHVFEILRKLSLAPHLLEECCEFCHQPRTAILVDFRWDCVGSWYFTAGNLLHGPDGFWVAVGASSGDDEAVICQTIGIAGRLGYQHVLSISPPDENIVQKLPAPRPRVYPRGLLLRRKSKEGVDQQETVFRTGLQKKEAVIVTATETVGTQHSLPGSVFCPDAGVEVTKDKQLISGGSSVDHWYPAADRADVPRCRSGCQRRHSARRQAVLSLNKAAWTTQTAAELHFGSWFRFSGRTTRVSLDRQRGAVAPTCAGRDSCPGSGRWDEHSFEEPQLIVWYQLEAATGAFTSFGFFPAATPWANVTTGGLNQVRVSGVVCASTPGILTPELPTSPLSKSPTVGATATPPPELPTSPLLKISTVGVTATP
ncbi:unnamed protein product [Schistocephalus solidus]|uniref:DOMON domain-containing protein n=1 Tax=Schistocephalus solidus TaxID=70667 RepID=A0A183TET6_SCHSO|nr:unnamed protein product [Schistocephalus solidus]